MDLIWTSLLSILGDPLRLLSLCTGVVAGFAAGLVPGIGGRVGILLALPLVTSFDPLNGAIFLLAMHAVVHTSGAIPPIAYGLPTSAAEAATAIEGYQLRRQGRAAEALGASLGASAIGGVLGALAFFAMVPIVRPIVTNFGAPEFLVLSLLGLSLVAALNDGNLFGGIAVGALGLLASTVGIDVLTGDPRFTFGRLELWDGVQLVPIVGGLFVVPEMLDILARPPAPARERALTAQLRQVVKGITSVIRHKLVLIRSTLIGFGVGITPGVGASVAVWISYADAARLNRDTVPFGTGAISGVIAPEAANNSKEGGALVPTVFFGIPGSSGMAIMMGAFAMLGIQLGPKFLGPELGTALSFGWTVALANILAVPIFFLVIPLLVHLTAPRPTAIVPFALVASVTATWAALPGVVGVAQFAVASFVGVLLKSAGLARAPLLLGLVMGPIAETSLSKTVTIWGFGALIRPGVLILGAILLFVLIGLRRPSSAPRSEPRRSQGAGAAAYLMIILVAIAAIATAAGYKTYAALAPVSASIVGLVFATIAFVRDWRQPATAPQSFRPTDVAAFSALLVAVPLVGVIPASLVFLILTRKRIGEGSLPMLAVSLIGVAVMQFLLVGELLERQLGYGWIGEAIADLLVRGG